MIGLCLGVALAIEPVIEELPGGRVDWTTLELQASASGRPSSGVMLNYDTLEGDARARLGPAMLGLARLVRVTSTSTTREILEAGDAVADRVDANIALWEVYEARYFSSGGVELDGALALHAWLRPALVTLAKGRDRQSPPTGSTSGLIVDARGLDVQPAVAPRIEGGDGHVVYSIGTLTSYAASQRGPAVYVTDPADVAAVRRAGEQPMFVRATAVVAETDLVLAPEDVAAVEAAASLAPFLLHGNVVIVVNP